MENAALVVFDAVITFDREVVIIWRSKWKLSTWLYIVNHYTALAYFTTPFVTISNLAVCVSNLSHGFYA